MALVFIKNVPIYKVGFLMMSRTIQKKGRGELFMNINNVHIN